MITSHYEIPPFSNSYRSVPSNTRFNNDSIKSNAGKSAVNLGAPIIASDFPASISYGKEYKGIIKVASANPFETRISADVKPDFLTFRSGVFFRLFAGSTVLGTANGPRLSARFYAPCALTTDSEGNLYIADQADNRIRKINQAGIVSTVAGSISAGFKDGAAAEARFDSPFGIAVGETGALFISDQENNAIRMISADGMVSTFAGGKTSGYVDGAAQDAKFRYPSGICRDIKGNLYVADRGNHCIRKISPDGIVTTLAGSGQPGFADGKGSAAKFSSPTGVAVDSLGYVFVADQINNRIRKISPDGLVSTLAGSGEFSKLDGNGKNAAFRYPTSIIIDPKGGFYVSDQLNHTIRRLSNSGVVSTITPFAVGEVKDDTQSFKNPMGLCINKEGKLMVADFNNHSIKEISAEASLAGIAEKSQLGKYKVVLKASNEHGSDVKSIAVLVRDTIAPLITKIFPENGTTGLGRNFDLMINFEEEIRLNKSGSLSFYTGDQLVRKYNLSDAFAANELIISDDDKTITLKVKSMPAGASISVNAEFGMVSDTSGNLFKNTSAQSQSWTLTTKPLQQQAIELGDIPGKIYGDPAFNAGPMQSSAGLPVRYYTLNPEILQVAGDSVKILKTGSTKIIAVQEGNSEFAAARLERAVTVVPRNIIIRPVPGQSGFGGEAVPPIKFELVAGMVLKTDEFTGSLQIAPGSSIGTYPITIGNLSLGENYALTLEPGTFEVIAAPAAIKPAVSCTNLISANADGINDMFIVRNIEQYPGNELRIVDRSGMIVFRQKNYENNWDGRYKGTRLPVGTYYYHLDLGNNTGQLKGHISLVD
ncbi:T9SS type B sorting domain-containing protein [Daejeonella lutea]|nr:gliding motility-associated C-terminal domain-containing protein [Daejeonella lutea]